jgi:Reverse transcriptase (RNA-dependent DNA polymerase)
MLHAQHRWPNAINTHLWPFAIKMANDLSNRAPAIQSGISPLELFSQVEMAPKVKHSHTFGAPVYVLDNALQTSGTGIPKWQSRANMGIYVGTSPRHSRKIALVLNLVTGHVSPQFHVMVDDFFETLRPSTGNSVPKSDWQRMTGFIKGPTVGRRHQTHATEQTQITPLEQEPWQDVTEVNNQPATTTEDGYPIQSEEYDGDREETEPATVTQTQNTIPSSASSIDNEAPRATRSERIPKATTRMKESLEQQRAGIVSLHVEWEVFHDDTYTIQHRMEQPLAFVASTNPDVMYMDQAMKEPDSEQFHQAMLKEVKAHTDNGHWTIVRRDTVPHGVEVLPSVWAMRRKRRILTGEPYKWKARLNVHGGKQVHGVNYWETYAPVIAWTTIRLYLIMALLNKKTTRQIDFVLAYPQADIECDLYMEIPRGFEFQGSRKTHCLLLNKNLYGQKQAGRVWNVYLHEGLLARGFEQSTVDMCLYYNKQYKVNLLIYTDDGILIGNNDADIDAVIALLREPTKRTRAFNMTDEGNLNDYLGVKVEYLPNGAIKLS